MSYSHLNYLKRIKKEKILVLIFQILIFITIIILWEVLSKTNKINTFLTSSPSLILKTIINLYKSNNLFNHIGITLYETLISFMLSTLIGIVIATILWWNKFIFKVIDPY